MSCKIGFYNIGCELSGNPVVNGVCYVTCSEVMYNLPDASPIGSSEIVKTKSSGGDSSRDMSIVSVFSFSLTI